MKGELYIIKESCAQYGRTWADQYHKRVFYHWEFDMCGDATRMISTQTIGFDVGYWYGYSLGVF